MNTPNPRSRLFARLDTLGLAHRTVDHPAVFTVEESREIKKSMPGGHSKNLFLKDKAGTLTLVTAFAETAIDLKALGKTIGSKQRLSFGKPELMTEVLGVIPGAVTPFALMNDTGQRISNVIIDKAFFDHDPVWFHPLENTASTAIQPDSLVTFIRACGHDPQIMDFSALSAGA